MLETLERDLEHMSARALQLQEDATRAQEKANQYGVECARLEIRIALAKEGLE